MPWTVDDPPPPAKNWTDEEKKKCVKAANDELAGGSTDEEAVFACIHAAGKSKRGKSMDEIKSEDLDKLLQIIHTAFREQFPTDDAQPITRNGHWVTRTFDDHLIVEEMAGTALYKVGYSKNMDGKVSIAPRSEWEEVHIEYMAGPAKSIDGLNDDTVKRYISPKVREKVPQSDCAGKNGSFPIIKPADVAAAAHAMGRAGPDNYDTETIKRNIIRIAKRKGAEFVAKLPKAWREEKKSIDDLLCVKSLGQNRFGGYLVLWGDPERKDLTGEYFTPETQEMLNVFEAVGGIPAMYHHAADDTVKSDVLGKLDVMSPDDVGLWVEAQARKAAKYRDAVADLIERKSLYWSSGCLPKSRKVAPDGKIERWTICDATLTPTPAEHRMVDRPIQAIKSIYEQAGLAFPDDKGSEATVASPAGDADDARQRAIREGLARLRLLKVKAGITEE